MRKRSLTDDQVAEIKRLGQTTMKRVDIARQFHISPQLVSTIVKYGYDNRPIRVDRKKVDPESHSWEALAREYNKLYPEDPITGPEAKAIHDLTMKKFRAHFAKQNLTLNDLL